MKTIKTFILDHTITLMALLTLAFVCANIVHADQHEQLIQDCLSDYVLDWHDPRCLFLHPE